MALANEFTGRVFEDGHAELHGKLTDSDVDGTALTQSDVSDIDYWVYNAQTGALVISVTALTISDVLNDSVDSNDHNFHVTFPPATFPDGNTDYELYLKFTTTGGQIGYAKGELECERVRPST